MTEAKDIREAIAALKKAIYDLYGLDHPPVDFDPVRDAFLVVEQYITQSAPITGGSGYELRSTECGAPNSQYGQPEPPTIDSPCLHARVDHNLECLDCDEPVFVDPQEIASETRPKEIWACSLRDENGDIVVMAIDNKQDGYAHYILHDPGEKR